MSTRGQVPIYIAPADTQLPSALAHSQDIGPSEASAREDAKYAGCRASACVLTGCSPADRTVSTT